RGPDTFTSSNYRVVDEGEICDPGADAEPDPELAVASLAADSSLAVSLRSAHDPETLGTQSQPFVDDLTRSGVQEVTTEDGTMTAYVVPVGGDESSAYIAHPDGVTRSAGAGGT